MQKIGGRAFVMIGLWGTMSLAGGSELILYPESSRNLDSPDKNYYIYVRENNAEPFHSAFLFSKAGGESLKIVDFSRHIDVAWSPDSLMFYVNDYIGSDFATCRIFGVNGKEYADIVSFLKRKYEKFFLKNDHIYGVCKKWTNDGVVVELSLHGNYSGSGFSKTVFVHKKSILFGSKGVGLAPSN